MCAHVCVCVCVCLRERECVSESVCNYLITESAAQSVSSSCYRTLTINTIILYYCSGCLPRAQVCVCVCVCVFLCVCVCVSVCVCLGVLSAEMVKKTGRTVCLQGDLLGGCACV